MPHADHMTHQMFSVFKDLELDDLHVYQYRLNGAVSLGNAAFSWVARRFRFGDEKRAVILSHFLVSLLHLV